MLTLFVPCCCAMLLCFVIDVPRSSLAQHAPLRGLRVGIGLQVVFGLAATWIPTAGYPQNESLLVWFLITVLLSGLAGSVILARSGTTVMLQVRVFTSVHRCFGCLHARCFDPWVLLR